MTLPCRVSLLPDVFPEVIASSLPLRTTTPCLWSGPHFRHTARSLISLLSISLVQWTGLGGRQHGTEPIRTGGQ